MEKNNCVLLNTVDEYILDIMSGYLKSRLSTDEYNSSALVSDHYTKSVVNIGGNIFYGINVNVTLSIDFGSYDLTTDNTSYRYNIYKSAMNIVTSSMVSKYISMSGDPQDKTTKITKILAKYIGSGVFKFTILYDDSEGAQK
jgi:hypothetical protein